MADPYIDQFETLIYGQFAREQMAAVCIGRIADLDSMVQFAIDRQQKVDAKMKDVLDRQPKTVGPISTDDILKETRDVIVRFGSYLDSLKGRPVDPRVFFRGENPSVLARRRMVKLTAAVKHIVEQLTKHASLLRGSEEWLEDFRALYKQLQALEMQSRTYRVERAVLAPEVSEVREAWLTVYGANKNLIRGLLQHDGHPELMPLIFDDLAEVHRTSGTKDDDEAPPNTPPVDETPDS